MSNPNKLLRNRLASLPILEAERRGALRLVEQGESIADALLTLGRVFRRAPSLRHASH